MCELSFENLEISDESSFSFPTGFFHPPWLFNRNLLALLLHRSLTGGVLCTWEVIPNTGLSGYVGDSDVDCCLSWLR